MFILKLADIAKYVSDGNKEEFEADLPAWLTPPVRAYVSENVCLKRKTSVLILDRMDKSLRDCGAEVPCSSLMISMGQEYAEMIAESWLLFSRCGTDTQLTL